MFCPCHYVAFTDRNKGLSKCENKKQDGQYSCKKNQQMLKTGTGTRILFDFLQESNIGEINPFKPAKVK
jgi:hypothetical protein